MKTPPQQPNEFSDIEEVAALWATRIDRGLTAEEQDDYMQWLSESPRHREAMRLFQWAWDEFDRLAGLQTSHEAVPDPDLLAPGSRFTRGSKIRKLLKFSAFVLPTAIAAALAIAFFLEPDDRSEPQLATQIAAPSFQARIEKRTLEDGSQIEINRGGLVQTLFSSTERRVVLVRGEANFTVVKDPSRPFIVEAAGASVRAVGTQFNMKLGDEALDVIVTEGIVSVQDTLAAIAPAANDQLLRVNQQAIVTLDSGDSQIEVTTLSSDQIEAALSWQPKLLDFDSAPLREIVAAFNRSNSIQILLGDSELENIELSCAFWSDNTEGFVRLMESSFNMQAEWLSSRELILR
ncbi:FecR family protein [Pelagicoccus mobilis]|uniref:FecR domain-containing protein n=1 Tax=Pelagicoccus mobilis TaxID=415221 RepID=A0A934RY10_9BACT|nr:FecR domain-containing protein [Pelagicoccus mobilis]MBK1875628.1 FecR domain-containing protein [Pelagicoccus mobilis]